MKQRIFTGEQIAQFFATYGDFGKSYTAEQVDRFEFAVNRSVMSENHPSMKSMV